MKSSYFAILLIALTAGAAAPQERRIQFGVEQRVREERWNNIIDYDPEAPDERNQIRYRTRVWLQAPAGSNLEFGVGLNQETSQWITPRTPWRLDEIIVENAWVEVKKVFFEGLSVRAGRQNLARGEGFILFDGGPWDGSRTSYVNAVDLAYARGKSKLEAIVISDPANDHYLPRWHDRHRMLIEWDERAYGGYFTSTAARDTSLEAYYFYKTQTGSRRGRPDRRFSTAGGRAVRQLARGFELTGEIALQWGRQAAAHPISASGGYAYFRKRFDAPLRPVLTGGYWRLSGDDPRTPGNEGWDPLFARWPKWSDLYLYSYSGENGPGYATNTGMWQGEVAITPARWLTGRITYYHLDAIHPYQGPSRVFGSGTGRGHNWQTRWDVTLNRSWKAHFVYELLRPGSFYSHHTRGSFLRWETSYAYKGYPWPHKRRAPSED